MKYAISKYNGEGRQNPDCPEGQNGNVVKSIFYRFHTVQFFPYDLCSCAHSTRSEFQMSCYTGHIFGGYEYAHQIRVLI